MASISSLPRLKEVLEHRWLADIGTFAYSLYLVHAIVLLTLAKVTGWSRLGGSPLAALGFLVVGGAASLFVARGFYLLGERPFYRRRHRPSTTES